MKRRQFLARAAALGASGMWCGTALPAAAPAWRERGDLYPQGVASGDPDPNSVLLWTRYPPQGRQQRTRLTAQVAEDPQFAHILGTQHTTVAATTDWTCRVLVAGLQPAHEYFYRFIDADGNGSRIGRTLTAPRRTDKRPVHFAFVSCQNVNYGAQNAWRRMIHDDERAAPSERLGFVLHLGDFIYELVWYPEDRPQGMYDRRLRDILRYEHGEKIDDFHIPTTTDDYRAVYRAYLADPDIQDARARWPFVTMWDNHEFSWQGWQGLQKFNDVVRPAQSRKVAANQAWFEYQPARVRQPSQSLLEFDAPAVVDAPIDTFDDAGFGQERNNQLAVASLRGYRSLRWGAHVDLIITDQHSYRSEDPLGRVEARAFTSPAFPELMPEEAQQILDAGRSWNHGSAPSQIRFGEQQIANFRRAGAPQTVLGHEQKRWFLQQLSAARATWKIWANTAATLDMRADPQNLPDGLATPWPGAGYAGFGGGDPSTAYAERAELYDFVASRRITGFATIAGDRHSFWAGLAAKALPPSAFEPVGVAFVTGSLSAPGMIEAIEHSLPKQHALRPLFLADRADGKPEPTVNLLLRHGVRTALDYARHGQLEQACALRNPDNAPHVSFVDMGGHGYAVVHASAATLGTEFVCIPRPLERSESADGGPLRYRVMHRVPIWRPGERPDMSMQVIEGDAGLSA